MSHLGRAQIGKAWVCSEYCAVKTSAFTRGFGRGLRKASLEAEDVSRGGCEEATLCVGRGYVVSMVAGKRKSAVKGGKNAKAIEAEVVTDEPAWTARSGKQEPAKPTLFQYLVSAALGALVGGIPSGLVFFCCCLFQVLGGFAGGAVLRAQVGRRITTAEAAAVGAVGGFAAGAIQGAIETAKAVYLPGSFGIGDPALVFAGVFLTAIYVFVGAVLGIAGAMLATLWE